MRKYLVPWLDRSCQTQRVRGFRIQSSQTSSFFAMQRKLKNLGPIHTTPFLFVSVFVASKLPVHTAPFLYKNGEKNLRFCAFTFICLITNTEPKISVFVRSHCSEFVKLLIGYWSVFKNLRFCGYPLLTAFSKTSVSVAFLCGSV